ncbi:hypothetical protein Trydic_g753 [Trypoxylus dichotomus]
MFQNAVEPMQVDAPPEDNDNNEEETYIVENPSLDLEVYANSYMGLAKLYRLIFIIDHCPSLRLEALKMAISYVMTTYNYTRCCRSIYITRYTNNRYIRRGHDDLGDHYLDCGDLSNALKCYSRSRDYCTSGKHVVNIYVSKAENTPDFMESQTKDTNLLTSTKLKCAAGLAELATKKYKSAAKHFLQANLDHCDFPELMSANNVAMYGGLCALATFDRHELQKNVIFSSSFKLFLELEPQLRDIIFKFYESKYASCLKLLDEIKDNLLLDMYIAPHVNTLYTQIRNRALIQYFSPYLSADMHKMATAFNRTVSALEDELMQLILEGQIQARIDSHNKILFAKDVDQRSTTFEKSLQMGKEYQRRTRMLILRAAVLKNKIHVKSPQRETTGQTSEITVAPGTSTVLAARN